MLGGMVTRRGRSRKGDCRRSDKNRGRSRRPLRVVRWTMAPDAPTIIAIRPRFVPGHFA